MAVGPCKSGPQQPNDQEVCSQGCLRSACVLDSICSLPTIASERIVLTRKHVHHSKLIESGQFLESAMVTNSASEIFKSLWKGCNRVNRVDNTIIANLATCLQPGKLLATVRNLLLRGHEAALQGGFPPTCNLGFPQSATACGLRCICCCRQLQPQSRCPARPVMKCQ